MFALTSVVEALTPIAASPLYTFVYNATLLIFPGTFYIVSSAIFAVDVILLRFVATHMNCLMLYLISNNFITFIIHKFQQNVLTVNAHTGWRTKCHTIECAHNTFLLLQKHLTSGTELILISWKIVPNEEHVQCDHCFASQPLANEPLHSSQLFDTSLQKARGTTSLSNCARRRPENVVQLRAHIVKLCCALSEDLCRKVVMNARVRLQEVVRQNGGHIEHVLH